MKSDFIKLYESLNFLNESINLQEAKQDTLNFKNWLIDKGASEFEADEYTKRFDKIKQFLKAPETDYYYWIKNKKPQDLYDVVNDTERVIEVKRTKKAEIADGAELVNETEHWKIYHITNFEASQYYGRDSKWCITGVGSYGDRYWRDYIRRGYEFYFIITKENYDPRGSESKFAFAILENVEYYQIFDQQDSETNLEDIPYYEEIKIPGINLDYYTNDEPYFCDDCGDVLSRDGDGTYWSPDGNYCYCGKCWEDHYFYCQNCGDAFSWEESHTGADDYRYCYECWCEYFTDCYNCGDIIEHSEAREGADYNYYCEACWGNSFFICQECDEVYWKDDDLVETNDGEFCNSCYKDLYEEDEK